MRDFFAVILSTFLLAACAPTVPPLESNPGEPIAQQLLRAAPWLRDTQFSVLLNFESPDDALFIAAGHGSAIVSDRAFTGRHSYRIDPITPTTGIKLNSLLAGRPFPADWTMVGAFIYASEPSTVTARLDAGAIVPAAPTELKPGVWTPVFVDIPASSTLPSASAASSLTFEFQSPHNAVWIDDVILVNNLKSLITTPAGRVAPSESAWTVNRRGTQLSGGTTGEFHFSLATADVSSNGWVCDEANALRARFHSVEAKTLTVYSDGRAYWSGEYRPMSGRVRDAAYASANQSPATLEIAENMGRLDRNTAGDSNNDGYNESTGSYRIAVDGPRTEIRFVPSAGVPDPRPVLELSGLSFGKVLATLEGRLIESTVRTVDGHVLIELPATIDRPVTVDVRVENQQ